MNCFCTLSVKLFRAKGALQLPKMIATMSTLVQEESTVVQLTTSPNPLIRIKPLTRTKTPPHVQAVNLRGKSVLPRCQGALRF